MGFHSASIPGSSPSPGCCFFMSITTTHRSFIKLSLDWPLLLSETARASAAHLTLHHLPTSHKKGPISSEHPMAFQLKIPVFHNIPSKQHAHFITATGTDSNRQKAVSNIKRHNRQKEMSNITRHKKAKTRALQQFATWEMILTGITHTLCWDLCSFSPLNDQDT